MMGLEEEKEKNKEKKKKKKKKKRWRDERNTTPPTSSSFPSLQDKTHRGENEGHGGKSSTIRRNSSGSIAPNVKTKTSLATDNAAEDSVRKKKARLNAARFRMLNEELYTTTSGHHVEMFTDEKHGESAWFRYHEGYKNQVQQWPLNPLDVAFKWLRAIVDSKTKNAIRGEIVDTATLENTNRLVAADFGCGEAELSIRMRDYNCDVHNFDLVAVNDSVTKCSMTNVPLPNDSIDAAIFCLSLMGVDYGKAILEARRVLKDKGKLFIAEVRSRFANAHADYAVNKVGSHTSNKTLRLFLTALKDAGFAVIPVECDLKSNSHFISISCQLNKRKGSGREHHFPDLKPCTYKKR